jgi:hypothetical protein
MGFIPFVAVYFAHFDIGIFPMVLVEVAKTLGFRRFGDEIQLD